LLRKEMGMASIFFATPMVFDGTILNSNPGWSSGLISLLFFVKDPDRWGKFLDRTKFQILNSFFD
jgi:hypothetical protein